MLQVKRQDLTWEETKEIFAGSTIPRGGGGLIWVGMCRPGLQIGTPFLKKFPLKLIPRSRIRPKTNTPF